MLAPVPRGAWLRHPPLDVSPVEEEEEEEEGPWEGEMLAYLDMVGGNMEGDEDSRPPPSYHTGSSMNMDGESRAESPARLMPPPMSRQTGGLEPPRPVQGQEEGGGAEDLESRDSESILARNVQGLLPPPPVGGAGGEEWALRPPPALGGGGEPVRACMALLPMPPEHQALVPVAVPPQALSQVLTTDVAVYEGGEGEVDPWVEMDQRCQLAVREAGQAQNGVAEMQLQLSGLEKKLHVDVQFLQRALLGEGGLDVSPLVLRNVSPRELSLQVGAKLEEFRKALQVANETLSQKIQRMGAVESRVLDLENKAQGVGLIGAPPPVGVREVEHNWQEVHQELARISGALEEAKTRWEGGPQVGGVQCPVDHADWQGKWDRLYQGCANLEAQVQELQARLSLAAPPAGGGVSLRNPCRHGMCSWPGWRGRQRKLVVVCRTCGVKSPGKGMCCRKFAAISRNCGIKFPKVGPWGPDSRKCSPRWGGCRPATRPLKSIWMAIWMGCGSGKSTPRAWVRGWPSCSRTPPEPWAGRGWPECRRLLLI